MLDVCCEMEPESMPERCRSLTEFQRTGSQLPRLMLDMRLDRLRIGLQGRWASQGGCAQTILAFNATGVALLWKAREA